MKAIIDYIKSEPARLLSLLSAAFAMFAAFGLDLSQEQVGTIMAFVAILVGIVVRQSVTPNIKVAAKEAEAPGAGEHTELVAGPASDITDNTPVDVVPADFEARPSHPGADGTNL